jgi:hypothetical protein
MDLTHLLSHGNHAMPLAGFFLRPTDHVVVHSTQTYSLFLPSANPQDIYGTTPDSGLHCLTTSTAIEAMR